jgi:hypothetical protein
MCRTRPANCSPEPTRAHFPITLNVVPLVIPSSTILFQSSCPQVGVVNSHNQVELRKVKLWRDFGDTIEIVSGVSSADCWRGFACWSCPESNRCALRHSRNRERGDFYVLEQTSDVHRCGFNIPQHSDLFFKACV